MAQRIGLSTIAFADHNSVAGVAEGFTLSREFGIDFIPCLELNSFFEENDLHILGYFIEYEDHGFIAWLYDIHREKMLQAVKRIGKLNEMGFVVTVEDVEKFSQGRVPTGASYLRAILGREENRNDPRLEAYTHGERSASPYVNFYRDFLRGGKPGFVPIDIMETLRVIGKIREFGGIPILAHPSDTPKEYIRALIERGGLCGLEVYSSCHTPEEEAIFLSVVEDYRLLATAGSDFHGETVKPDVKLAAIRGNTDELVEKLKEFKRTVHK